MRRAGTLIVIFLPWLLALGGCRCDDAGAPSASPTATSAASEADREPSRLPTVHPPAPMGPLATVIRVVDDPQADGPTSVSASERLSAGALIESGGATVVVDFHGGGRVELYPGSRAVIGGEAPAQIFVGQGSVRAALAPAGNSTRPPLRVGTPAGSVEIAGSGDVVVMTLPDGASWFATLSGSASVARGDVDAETLPFEPLVGAQRALLLGVDPEAELEDVPSPEGLVAIRARALELQDEASTRAAEGWAAEVATRRAALEETLATATALQRDEAEILAARNRPDPANPNWRRDVVIRAIQHSLRLRRDRRLVLTRYERWRAACVAAAMPFEPAVRDRVRDVMASAGSI